MLSWTPKNKESNLLVFVSMEAQIKTPQFLKSLLSSSPPFPEGSLLFCIPSYFSEKRKMARRVLEQYTPEQQCQLPNRSMGLHLSRRQEVDALKYGRSKSQVPLFLPNVFTTSPAGILHLARLTTARNNNKKKPEK